MQLYVSKVWTRKLNMARNLLPTIQGASGVHASFWVEVWPQQNVQTGRALLVNFIRECEKTCAIGNIALTELQGDAWTFSSVYDNLSLLDSVLSSTAGQLKCCAKLCG